MTVASQLAAELDGQHGHIPGSSIDFSLIRGVIFIEPDAVQRSPVPREISRATGLRGTERIVTVADPHLGVGDLVATRVQRSHGVSIGRPMQVRHVVAGTAYAVDDSSLGSAKTVHAGWASPFSYGNAAAWRLLYEWGVFRCPRCRAPGLFIQRGMSVGPPRPGVIDAGCVLGGDDPDVQCSRCPVSWHVRPIQQDR